ncbi:PilN family type IV pilus biogenesis protein TapN [Aeromonas bivalvium]|uniref:PilN family type IV pilus biogenesis protein TapN n=1 Tax=Aeromonas bivalvium TaxID=440079 RepID=UPI0038D1A060
MSNINLLPWREARQKREKAQFGVLFGVCLAVTASLGFGVDWFINQQIASQREVNQRLVREMVTLDAQLGEIRLIKEKRQGLLDRMQLIERLQQRRNLPVRLFNQLPLLVPNGVYLNTLALKHDAIDVNGKAEAYGRVASMMRRIDGAGWLGSSRLSTIFASDVAPVVLSQFSMMFQVTESPVDGAGGNKS